MNHDRVRPRPGCSEILSGWRGRRLSSDYSARLDYAKDQKTCRALLSRGHWWFAKAQPFLTHHLDKFSN